MQHIEMIIDYITDGTDYQYCDNHGVLIRCKDCKWFYENKWCVRYMYAFLPDEFCSSAERREE